MGKETLHSPPQSLPSHIHGEPWGIQLEREKIIKDQQARIYEHVHKGKALAYRAKKKKIKKTMMRLTGMPWRKQKRNLTFINDGSPPNIHLGCAGLVNFLKYGRKVKQMPALDVD